MGGRLCGDRVYKKSLYFLLSFAMNLKLLLKKLSPFVSFLQMYESIFKHIETKSQQNTWGRQQTTWFDHRLWKRVCIRE